MPFPEHYNTSVLIGLYRAMVTLRLFDQKAVALQRTGQMGTFPSSLGQEALMIGCGQAMEPTDVLCPYYRDHGILTQRGVLWSEILTYWGGDERGSCFSHNTEDFPMAVPIASQLLHAVGVAYAMKLRHQKRAALTTCGDGATSKGDFYEAINAAGVWRLPVVFVVNNNQWAISTPRCAQTATPYLAQKAEAAGFENLRIDGNDVIAVHHTVKQAINKAKAGGGPTLIEAVTYRLSDHTTADDASRYQAPQHLDTAWTQEPIQRLHTYLCQKNLWNDEQQQSLETTSQQTIQEAVNTYLQRQPAHPTAMLDHLYAELPPSLYAQYDQLIAEAS